MILPVVDRDVLIFDSNTAQSLRREGIMGNLIGSLSVAPQQNNFLGLPLKLLPYEVVWLVENGLAVLKKSTPLLHKFDNRKAQYYITPRLMDADVEKTNESAEIVLESESLYAQFRSRVDEGLYSIFSQLRSKGYFILPGFKFGGEFIAYPGDPLRYHSHLIVNSFESINFYNLVVSGRLASGVKKLYVVSKPTGVEEVSIAEVIQEPSTEEDSESTEINQSNEVTNEVTNEMTVSQTLILNQTEISQQREIIQQNASTENKAPTVYKKYKNLSFSIEWAGFG